MVSVYQPAEDSYFFVNVLKEYWSSLDGDYLDMGTGSGILAREACKVLDPGRVVACDINGDAVSALSDESFLVVHSDFFSKVSGSFGLISFNAPYLPLDEREPEDSRVATTGGVRGDEASLKFLSQALGHLIPGGKILLLVSSLTPMDRLEEYSPIIVARKGLFAEELLILEFSKS
jgi:release factor glutamine methyltransferase